MLVSSIQARKTGRPAKSCTADEVIDFLEDVRKKLEGKTSLYRTSRKDNAPVYVMDNDKIHIAGDIYCRTGLVQQNSIQAGPMLLKIPPYSSEFNKPIEHVHSILQDRFTKHLLQYQALPDIQVLQKWLESMFYDGGKDESTRLDILSLRQTYQQVVQQDGGWIAHRFR